MEAVDSEGATADDPAQAVDHAYSEGLFLGLPDVVLRLAAEESDRRLVTEGAGGAGWYLEAWARCDSAEFPASVAAATFGDSRIWTDGDGVPVPTTPVYSARAGALRLAAEELHPPGGRGRRSRNYVEAPEPGLSPYVAGRYPASVPLPANARDTGWEREGRHLWLSTDGRSAFVGDADAVARSPRFESGCE